MEAAGEIPAVRFYSCSARELLLRFGGGQGLQSCVEAALVAGNGVRVQNALLDALVEHGDCRAVLLLSGLYVALGEGLTQGAQAGAHTSTIGAVHLGAGYGLTRALERGNLVCHCSSLILS